MRSYPPPPSTRKRCVDPIAAVQAAQITMLDPTGARKRLFARDNPESAKVGDILLVRIKNGEPYAGVCLNIRRRGVDTAILLRNQLTRVGVEMWYKIYSPKVTGIEVVQRREKRARRAKLYYMRYVIISFHAIGRVLTAQIGNPSTISALWIISLDSTIDRGLCWAIRKRRVEIYTHIPRRRARKERSERLVQYNSIYCGVGM
jgi:ribosomal protein L19